MKRIVASVLALVILGTLLLSIPLQAQATKADIVLTGRYDGGKVYLKWSGVPADSVKISYIYRGLGGAMSAVMRIDSTTKNEYVDQPPASIILPVVYTISSVFKSGAVHYSNAVSVGPVEIVTITSVPTSLGIVNTVYTYQVKATSTQSGATLKYTLSVKPDRMTIDSVGGLIKWTPVQKGTFKATVVVTSSGGGHAEQMFTVLVSGPGGTVEGLATGPGNEPVANVAILLVPRASNVTQQFKIYTDRSGRFSLSPVDTGSYFVRAIPTVGNYAEQWYDGAATQDRATAILVKANTTTTVNFRLNAKVDVVQITSRPPETGSVGNLWTYPVLASSNDPSATLKYQLSYQPNGMTIDSVKGIVTWTPAVKGAFKVGILVVSSKGGRADQSFGITVSGPTGTVSGIVKDTLGKPLSSVAIQLYQANGAQATTAKIVTDSSGKYTIAKVDSGKYYARATPARGDYLEQWYNGAATLDKATAFTVLPNATTTVNFTLHSKPLPQQFTVRGSVLDGSHKPVKEATVQFTAPLSIAIGLINSSLATEIAYKVRVDTNGNYSIKLPQNTYIVMASASGYGTMYFNGKSDILTANPLVVSKDTSGIDFVLKANSQAATGKISGSVVDSTGAGLRAKVVAYRLMTIKPIIDGPGIYPGDADSTGKFTIANLAVGDYIVLAMPLGPYAPTYYSETGSTTNWERATKISISGNSVTGIKIVAKPLVKTTGGYNIIRGSVSVNGSSVQATQTSGADGAIVYAMLTADDVAGYGIVDESGNFAIEDLEPGDYTVVVDKVNFAATSSAKASSVFSTPDAMNTAATASLTLSPAVVTAVDENPVIPTDLVLEQNYPNPFNPSTAISYQLLANSYVTLRVFDLLGREVATLVSGAQAAGRHTIVWNAQNNFGETVSSGVYLYRLTAGGSVLTRRMVFLK